MLKRARLSTSPDQTIAFKLQWSRPVGKTPAWVLAICGMQACGGSAVHDYVRVESPVVALTHVRVIDGTGAPGKDDQTLIIDHGRIQAVTPAGEARVPATAEVIDLGGRTVIPGLVGMHNHLFYQVQPPSSPPTTASAHSAFAKLYLANGVTTIRTAGSADLGGDLRIKRRIDQGIEPGPAIHPTGPYVFRSSGQPDPDRVAREIVSQANAGATSIKVYTSVRSAELRAAIDAAHERGLRVTGHLCAVGYREAAALGIDNLEHGLLTDTEFYSGKQPDVCPEQWAVWRELMAMNVHDSAIQRTISELVRHRVTVTSTLAVFESFTGRDSVPDPRTFELLSSNLRDKFRAAHEAWSNREDPGPRGFARLLRIEMQFERQFAAAGGRLVAGADPTGWGGAMAGFADLRGVELLVEAGFTPEEAIKVATLNGAIFLYESGTIGSIESGKQADLVVVRGNPSTRISDVQHVELVFREGVGYDPAALIAATQGTVGRYDFGRFLRWPFNVLSAAVLALLAVRTLRGRRRPAPGAAVSP